MENVQEYVISPEKKRQLYKRTLFIVVLSQIFGGAGLAAGITVAALIAQDMLGTGSMAGFPTALFTLGSALTAYLVGRLSHGYGRRLGLSTGFIIGGLGAVGVVVATTLESVSLFFVSLFIYGAGTATNLLARYAGTDLANENQRATAVSIAMVFTTLGAVAGPNLVNVTGDFATAIGVPALAGPFILAAVAYILSGTVIFLCLRPDPYLIAQAIAQAEERTQKADTSTVKTANNSRLIVLGATVMIITQVVMVAIMTMTPIHMTHHGHEIAAVGIVIGIHVGAMYLPSLFTGYLVDKIGRKFMTVASAVTLLAAGLTATFAPATSLAGLIIALALLGIGWNFGLISGTTLIIDGTTLSTRAKTQGSIDVWIAIAGASSGALSGIVMAFSSYGTLALVSGLIAFVLVPVLIWSRFTRKLT